MSIAMTITGLIMVILSILSFIFSMVFMQKTISGKIELVEGFTMFALGYIFTGVFTALAICFL